MEERVDVQSHWRQTMVPRLVSLEYICRMDGCHGRAYHVWHLGCPLGWSLAADLPSGTIPREPPIRLLAMPVASMCFAFGIELLIVDVLRIAGYRAPVRISSLPRGSPLRPGVYSIIEDVVAVDGSGGTEFRQRLNLRYQASHYFRQMLHRITLFWAFGSCAIAVATTILVFTTSRNVAYAVSSAFVFSRLGIYPLTNCVDRMDVAVCLGWAVGPHHNLLGQT